MASVDLTRAQAHWVTHDTVAWNVPREANVTLHCSAGGGLTLGPDAVHGGTDVPLTFDAAGLTPDARARFPHLAELPTFKVPAIDVKLALRGQVAVSAK